MLKKRGPSGHLWKCQNYSKESEPTIEERGDSHDRPEQLSLVRVEGGAEHKGDTSTVRRLQTSIRLG